MAQPSTPKTEMATGPGSEKHTEGGSESSSAELSSLREHHQSTFVTSDQNGLCKKENAVRVSIAYSTQNTGYHLYILQRESFPVPQMKQPTRKTS